MVQEAKYRYNRYFFSTINDSIDIVKCLNRELSIKTIV